MMRRKVIFYPLYQETMVVENVSFDEVRDGVSYTHHYTLKTPAAPSWSLSSLLRELADRLDQEDNEVSEVAF
jgi:hypothetical protein